MALWRQQSAARRVPASAHMAASRRNGAGISASRNMAPPSLMAAKRRLALAYSWQPWRLGVAAHGGGVNNGVMKYPAQMALASFNGINGARAAGGVIGDCDDAQWRQRGIDTAAGGGCASGRQRAIRRHVSSSASQGGVLARGGATPARSRCHGSSHRTALAVAWRKRVFAHFIMRALWHRWRSGIRHADARRLAAAAHQRRRRIAGDSTQILWRSSKSGGVSYLGGSRQQQRSLASLGAGISIGAHHVASAASASGVTDGGKSKCGENGWAMLGGSIKSAASALGGVICGIV